MATLIAPANPSPVEDAEAIRKAVQGWGTDEKKIISVLGHRNAVQRKLIRKTYEETYQEDLIKRFESELHGNFEKAMFRWVLDPLDRDAVLANVALKESNADYRAIVELSCIYSPEELLAVKRAYQARYHHCLEEDLASHISGDLGKFVVALAGVYRYDSGEIDPRLAKSEANVLHTAIKDKVVKHDEITRIVGTRSKAQLIATFNCYKDEYGASITKDLLIGPANPFLAAVSTAVRCIKDPKKYYEKLLRDALQNGIDENALTRVIVTRAEKDLKEIMELYYKRNSVTLDHAVAKETSGDYKNFLLTLLGRQD